MQAFFPDPGPGRDCALCPRLVAQRAELRAAHPQWHNAPVPSFGGADARVLVVGLAPGLNGANRTGRPFTGDGAGEVLFPTLAKFGLARGDYGARVDDGFTLVGCRISNAVRCLPPANKPSASEVAACNGFLRAEIASLSKLKAILALGRVAHGAVTTALGVRANFAHGSVHGLDAVVLADSYHCSRYNMNTRRLTPEMFDAVVSGLARHL